MKLAQTYLFKKTLQKGTAVLLVCSLILGTCGIGTTAYGMEKPIRPANTSKSAITIDADTGETVYAKNPHNTRDPLSTTKLLTCLVALEHLELTDKVTVTKTAANTGGSTAYLKQGEKVRVKDLVYACMLPSGNDAAVALAYGTAGSTSKFAKLMNRKAKELGCVDSNFTNPHGWKAKNHYASAYDMALIVKAAMENTTIQKACSTEIYTMPKTNKHKARKIATTNYFVAGKKYKNPGVYASKTGTWDSRNASLASACKRDGKELYVVVLQDTTSGRYTTTNKIINYSYDKLEWLAQPEEPSEGM